MEIVQWLWWMTGAAAVVLAAVAYAAERYSRNREEFVEELVMAAEQYLTDNQERLQFVLGQLLKRYPRLDPELARVLIEAAVLRLKMAKGELSGDGVVRIQEKLPG